MAIEIDKHLFVKGDILIRMMKEAFESFEFLMVYDFRVGIRQPPQPEKLFGDSFPFDPILK
jgi:hypothetical protein